MARVEFAEELRQTRWIRVMVICFFICLALLIGKILTGIKDINDSWILEDVLPYFLLLALLYSTLVFFSSDLKLIAILTGIYLITINLIPNLKYVFIYGYNDPLIHYGSIQHTTLLGYASGIGAYATQYEAAPGMHILVSLLSTITGMNTLVAMKTFLVATPFAIPLAIYFVAKRISLPLGLAKATLAFVAIASPVTYTYFGASAIYPVYVLFLYMLLLVAACRRMSRPEILVAIMLELGVLISHDITSLFLLVYLFSFVAISKMGRLLRILKAPRRLTILIFGFIIIILAHFTLSSSISNFARIISLVEELYSSRGLVALSQYKTFYRLNFLEQIMIFFVRFGRDMFSILLVFFAPLAYFKLNLDNTLRRFYKSLVLPLILATTIFLLLLFLRSIVHREFYIYSILPFLGGLSILYLYRLLSKRFKKAVIVFSICGFVILSCLIVYPLQPLVPKVKTSEGISYYVLDLRLVNTVFDRSIISFVSTYNQRLHVWADAIMVSQIYALTNSSFYSLLNNNPSKSSILLVSHTDYTHTVPSGVDALDREIYLQVCVQQANTLYNNGYSYAFLNFSTIESGLGS